MNVAAIVTLVAYYALLIPLAMAFFLLRHRPTISLRGPFLTFWSVLFGFSPLSLDLDSSSPLLSLSSSLLLFLFLSSSFPLSLPFPFIATFILFS